ncbi:hypothetical protein TNCV_3100091 [Trichonephila clavipes]|nr:hypothetical protein TNCV_3100091 [Trichonephila clavipes]
MSPAEPERPPMEMVDLSVSVNTVEVTPPLITRCDKVPRQFPPTCMSNAWILERGAWNNHRPIKTQTGTLGGFKQHCIVGA